LLDLDAVGKAKLLGEVVGNFRGTLAGTPYEHVLIVALFHKRHEQLRDERRAHVHTGSVDRDRACSAIVLRKFVRLPTGREHSAMVSKNKSHGTTSL